MATLFDEAERRINQRNYMVVLLQLRTAVLALVRTTDTQIGVNQMTDIQIAQIVHEANRAYCHTLGDDTQVAWDDAPDWQKESAVNGVHGIVSGTITKPEQSHESWLAEKQRTGWKYGPVKNAETKEHPCFVPYADLPPEQQVKDAIFFAIVRACQHRF